MRVIQVSSFPSKFEINLIILLLFLWLPFSLSLPLLYVVVKMEYWNSLSNLIVNCIFFIIKIMSNFVKRQRFYIHYFFSFWKVVLDWTLNVLFCDVASYLAALCVGGGAKYRLWFMWQCKEQLQMAWGRRFESVQLLSVSLWKMTPCYLDHRYCRITILIHPAEDSLVLTVQST